MEDDQFEKSDDPSRDPDSSFFDRDRHICFLEMMYQLLPSAYQEQEINRLTLAYFVVSGLHILRAIERIDKEVVINWVLSLQARPKSPEDSENGQFYGFHGSRSSQFQSTDKGPSEQVAIPNGSHLASTYCALAILKIVGYDLSLIDSGVLLKSMKNLQQPDGCFMPVHTGAEKDLRFVFCAAAICSMLKNWSGIDRGKAKEYILSCQSYDGGFGLIPGSESHGGATYCAVASLQLMGFIGEGFLSTNPSCHDVNLPLLLDWSLQRQAVDGGFQGRINKPADTCYAFWVGGVLRILGADNYINEKALREFLLTCQSEYGGFSKFPRLLPDLYHSYYGFCAFSLLKESGLNSLCVELGASFSSICLLGDDNFEVFQISFPASSLYCSNPSSFDEAFSDSIEQRVAKIEEASLVEAFSDSIG
ncbi:geranylgeranyl transferase type-1 subunit beta-like [Dorcoceras hygrometricum]|uniref:Geranylgeranyl transferase type-1 subunit beta n=1 Tax=Dorcoceras hygrometricum TaxID=472368 RepID=A0A2Z7B0E5_9LAMI|nr:geranylgeranyl transferase type-1 subunit beta-like [Dorcoceras hygrometricum]